MDDGNRDCEWVVVSIVLEVGEGGDRRRYKVGRRSGSPPTEVETGVSRSKV